MFSEKEMSKAIDWLFELFEPTDYEGYDEEEIGYAGGLCMPEVCIALRGAMQTVYQYSVEGGYDKSFDYRGLELFGQRACASGPSCWRFPHAPGRGTAPPYRRENRPATSSDWPGCR